VVLPSSDSMCLSHELLFASRIVLFLIANILIRCVLSFWSRVDRHTWYAFLACFAAVLHSLDHHGFLEPAWGVLFSGTKNWLLAIGSSLQRIYVACYICYMLLTSALWFSWVAFSWVSISSFQSCHLVSSNFQVGFRGVCGLELILNLIMTGRQMVTAVDRCARLGVHIVKSIVALRLSFLMVLFRDSMGLLG